MPSITRPHTQSGHLAFSAPLTDLGGGRDSEADVRAVNEEVVLNSTRESELRSLPDDLYAYGLGSAPQTHDVIRILRSVGGDQDIALKLVARLYRVVHGAVKAVAADVLRSRTEWPPGAVAGQVQNPVEVYPAASAPLALGAPPWYLCGRLGHRTGAHHSEALACTLAAMGG